MDSSRTPKRKRRRVEAAAPRRGGKKSSSTASCTPGSGGTESKIVWKDSPADKQIKVSGTGKMAVRREMQGFVGRLARASQQSPRSSSEEEKKSSRERPRTRRKAVGTLHSPDKLVGGQRTPNNIRRRRSTEKGDSQDELFSVLAQMEQKYASPDVAVPLTGSRTSSPNKRQQYHQVPAVAVSTNEMNLTPTPVPSFSSTGTLSQCSSRTQETVKTQDITSKQEVVKAPTATKEQGTKTPEKPILVEVDPYDDLTDEQWALVDQMESQRAPVEASEVHSQSQTEFVSSQNLALTPRPMPLAAYGELKKPPPGPPSNNPVSVVRPMHTVETTQQLELTESYKRFLVLEVDRNVVNRSLLLR
ncbi:DNA2-like helicase, partial [Phytophthora palmivora]